MRLRELRKEYLTGQALSYITTGLFLISYTNTVQLRTFIFAVGIGLCIISFIDLVIMTFLPNHIRVIEIIDSQAKIIVFPITFLAIFFSIASTNDMGFVDLRLIIFLLWSLLALLSMGVGSFKTLTKHIKASNDTKGIFYKLFVFLSILSLAMGLWLMVYAKYDPKSAALMIRFNKRLYDPWTWFGAATLFVIPILILLPEEQDNNL